MTALPSGRACQFLIGPAKTRMIDQPRWSMHALRLPWRARIGNRISAIDDKQIFRARPGLLDRRAPPSALAFLAGEWLFPDRHSSAFGSRRPNVEMCASSIASPTAPPETAAEAYSISARRPVTVWPCKNVTPLPAGHVDGRICPIALQLDREARERSTTTCSPRANATTWSASSPARMSGLYSPSLRMLAHVPAAPATRARSSTTSAILRRSFARLHQLSDASTRSEDACRNA